MIQGTVVGLQARITVVVCLEEAEDIAIEFVVDAGFEGFLTLPSSLIAQLDLPFVGKIQANLTDNSKRVFEKYKKALRLRCYLAPDHAA